MTPFLFQYSNNPLCAEDALLKNMTVKITLLLLNYFLIKMSIIKGMNEHNAFRDLQNIQFKYLGTAYVMLWRMEVQEQVHQLDVMLAIWRLAFQNRSPFRKDLSHFICETEKPSIT